MAVIASLLVLYSMIHSTDATSQLNVRPDTFNAINGPALAINCTFDYSNSANIVSLVSIVLSKGDDHDLENHHFTEIALVTFSAPTVVTVLTPVNALTSGLVSKDGQSFLSLYWEHPSLNEEGLYHCNITGLDRSGKCVEIFHTSKVTAHKPTVNQLIENDKHEQMELNDVRKSLDTCNARLSSVEYTLSQVKVSLENLANKQKVVENSLTNVTLNLKSLNTFMNKHTRVENTMSKMNTSLESVPTKQTTLENVLTKLTKNLTPLRTFNASLRNTSTGIVQSQTSRTQAKPFHISPKYNGKYYLLSKNRSASVSDSHTLCEQAGGYLVEIEDSGEQEFIKTFMSTQTADLALTGGTDEGHEGKWVWRTSQRPVTLKNWVTEEPLNDEDLNCLWLNQDYNSRWSDDGCLGGHFLCEVTTI